MQTRSVIRQQTFESLNVIGRIAGKGFQHVLQVRFIETIVSLLPSFHLKWTNKNRLLAFHVKHVSFMFPLKIKQHICIQRGRSHTSCFISTFSLKSLNSSGNTDPRRPSLRWARRLAHKSCVFWHAQSLSEVPNIHKKEDSRSKVPYKVVVLQHIYIQPRTEPSV